MTYSINFFLRGNSQSFGIMLSRRFISERTKVSFLPVLLKPNLSNRNDSYFILANANFTFFIPNPLGIQGKCSICEKLKSLGKTCKSRTDRLLLRHYRMFHRDFSVGEKCEYYKRQNEAINSGGDIASIIFDACSKHKTQIPHMGDQSSFKESFNMVLMGCISHAADEKRFYLAMPSVKVNASFMIHCIQAEVLLMIQSGKIPKKLFIQIDGASDNTAKCVIAFLEHLVMMGIVDAVEVWRLPVGHTHEVCCLPRRTLHYPTTLPYHPTLPPYPTTLPYHPNQPP